MKKLLVVDRKYGPFKTIQEAINNSNANCLIKINAGTYYENINI